MADSRPNREPLVAPGAIEHHVADMTATISADVPLARVQAKLAAADQWLPIDGDASLTVGQLVEKNSTGPLRLGYGAWRDLLLGVQFISGRRELITAGGRTMKNVAGYDLTKFMVGQGEVFGTLQTITTRTYKRPAAALLATFGPQPRLIDRLIPSPNKPQWVMLTPDALLCGYLSDERTIAYCRGALKELNPRSIEDRSLQQDIAHRAQLWSTGSTPHFRAAVPPAKLSEFITTAALTDFAADAAFGIVVGRLHDVDMVQLQRVAADLGGVVTFYDEARGSGFILQMTAGHRALLKRLKQAFDPDNRLRPLPWQN